ncbi:hypothetical protein [Ferruginibacter sp.]
MIDTSQHTLYHQISLPDNQSFSYTISPFEILNALENVVAILQEYHFTRMMDNDTRIDYKLYRTKEGNWYDVEEPKTDQDKSIIRTLKSAIDTK